MMTRLVLAFLDLWQWFYNLLGVDYQQLRLLIWAKLTTDNRQDKTIVQRNSKKKLSNSMLFVVITYVIMGSLTSIILFVLESLLVSMTLIFSMILVMTAVALVSDFTSVLLDTTDNAILLPRPIDSRTAMVARITHIVLYLLMISLSLSLTTMILGTVKFGFLFLGAFLMALVMSVLLVVFAANVIYLLLMRGAHRERIRDSILYFQIFMAAVAMGSYQILPRLIGLDQIRNFNLTVEWWTWFLPPVWMAALIETAVTRVMTGETLILALLGVIVPLVSIVVVIRWLAPVFNRAISSLDLTGSTKGKSQLPGKRFNRLSTLASLVCRCPLEQESFKLIWRITARDRKFKIKTYPTFGYFILFALILTIFNDGDILGGIRSIPDSDSYVLYLHVSSLLVAISLLQQRFSDQYEAAWIYYSLPIERPGIILRSALAVMITKFGLILFLPVALIVFLIWGAQMWDDVILALLCLITNASFVALKFNKTIPFSLRYSARNEMSKGVTAFLMYMIPAILGVIHFALTNLPFGVPIASVVLLIIASLTIRDLGKTSWSELAGSAA